MAARGDRGSMGNEDAVAFGPYVVERRLGAGGMGVVYLASSPSGRQVAIKVIRESYAADPTFRQRFTREVAAARTVSGAFTAPVIDADTSGPVPWMATLYIPGPTLAEHVAANGPLDDGALVKLAAGLAEALRDIHGVGLVHRDLKPRNILLTADGPRVIDFGISRSTDADPLTQTGDTLGSPPYMAPEQFRSPRDTGPRADVFAFGCVIAYAATGRGPFDADNAYTTAWNVVHEAPDLDGLPAALLPLVEACLGKNVTDRPTAEELLSLVASPPPAASAAATASPALSPLSPAPDRPEPARPRFSRRWARIGARTALALVVAGAVWILRPDGGYGGTGSEPPKAAESGNEVADAPLREPHAAVRPKGWALWESHAPGDSPGERSVRTCQRADALIVCTGNGFQAIAFDIHSGATAWKSPQSGFRPADLVSTPASAGLTYLQEIDYGSGSPATGTLTALSTETGRPAWQTATHKIANAHIVGNLLVAATDVATTDRASTRVVARHAGNGHQRWARAFDARAMVVPDGTGVFVAVPKGELEGGPVDLMRLDADTGRTEWTRTVAQTYVGSVHGQLVFAPYGEVTALTVVDGTDGSPRRIALRTPATGALSLGGTSMYALRPDGRLQAYDVTDGTELWRADVGADVTGSAVVSGGRVYVQTLRSEIDCRDAANGTELWRSAPRRDPNVPVSQRPTDLVLFTAHKATVYAASTRYTVFALAPPRTPAGEAP